MIKQFDAIDFEDHRGGVNKMYGSHSDITFLPDPQQLLISYTNLKHTVRGLHFQLPPNLEKKLIYPINGSAVWFSIDMRSGPNFKKLYIAELDASKPKVTILEAGLAHGMISKSDDCRLIISSTEPMTSNSIEINVADPEINKLLIHLLPKTFIYDNTKSYVNFIDCCNNGMLPIKQ